jgi:hypothetical protein
LLSLRVRHAIALRLHGGRRVDRVIALPHQPVDTPQRHQRKRKCRDLGGRNDPRSSGLTC